jgi:phospholipid/cholesterol/gamma-HCH transport system permease protein
MSAGLAVFEYTGRTVLSLSREAGDTLILLWRAVLWARAAWQRRSEILGQMFMAGVQSFPIVLIVAVFTGMVLSLETGVTLARYQQQGAVGYIVSAAMCREMGPVMTAIILAGLVGSAMAAELGTMKVSDEIDALEVMSIDPVRFLVMPRILSLAIAGFLLTIYSNLTGICGGSVVARNLLGVSFSEYFRNARDVLEMKDIYTGLTKAFVFGIIVSSVSCSRGLKASGGAKGVGEATRDAVVTSFLFILVFNYILTWIFYG